MAAVAAAIGLTAGLLLAVGVGVVLTLVLVLRAVSQPRVRPLYPRAGRRLDAPTHRRTASHVPTYDDVLLLHLDGSLYTGNAQATQDAVLATALAARPARARRGARGQRPSTQVTVPMLDALRSMRADLRTEGIALVIAGFPADSLEAMRRSHVVHRRRGRGSRPADGRRRDRARRARAAD